jgi:hypothetical protein
MNLALIRLVAGYLFAIAAVLTFGMPDFFVLIAVASGIISFFLFLTPPRALSNRIRSKTETRIFLISMALVLLILHVTGWDTARHPAVKSGTIFTVCALVFLAFGDIRAQIRKPFGEDAASFE